MPRPRGSKNRPKHVIEAEKAAKAKRGATSAPPASTPGAGHNSELTEGEKQNRLIIGLGEIEKFEKEKDSIVAKVRNERKRLQSFGFTTEEINFALGLRKAKDEESVDRWRAMMRIARFLNHPIGVQPDLFDNAAKETPEQRAATAGKKAGLEGEPCKPPHDAGSPAGQAWIKAWHEGVAARNTAMSDAVQAAGAQPAADSGEAFDDAIDDAPSGEDASGEPSAEEIAAGRQEFKESLRDTIASGDDHNRRVAQQIDETRANGNDSTNGPAEVSGEMPDIPVELRRSQAPAEESETV